jgi:hypothetical protein
MLATQTDATRAALTENGPIPERDPVRWDTSESGPQKKPVLHDQRTGEDAVGPRPDNRSRMDKVNHGGARLNEALRITKWEPLEVALSEDPPDHHLPAL